VGDLEVRHAVLFPMGGITCMLAVQAVIRVLFTVKQKNIKTKAERGEKDFDVFNTLGQLVPQYAMYVPPSPPSPLNSANA
jgi:hypothetical protein